VIGLDRIPTDGPVIVASNHVSFVDPLILGGMIRRPVRFVMHYKIYKIPLLEFIFRTGKAIPIAGRSEDPAILESAYRRMHEVLAAGDVLGIFPEGRITADGEIGAFKPGIDKLMAEQPVPVVPVALCHLWGSLFSRRDPLHKRRPNKLWARIEMRVGAAIPPAEVSAARLEAEIRRLRGTDR
jgi:1-acyl-sn-glycerol-3-phosphate acyltransferase